MRYTSCSPIGTPTDQQYNESIKSHKFDATNTSNRIRMQQIGNLAFKYSTLALQMSYYFFPSKCATSNKRETHPSTISKQIGLQHQHRNLPCTALNITHLTPNVAKIQLHNAVAITVQEQVINGLPVLFSHNTPIHNKHTSIYEIVYCKNPPQSRCPPKKIIK